MKRSPINFCSILLISGQRVYPYIQLLLSSVSSSLNTSNPEPLEAMQLMHHTAPCFTDDVVCFGSSAAPSLLQTFLPIILVQVDLNSSAVQRMLFQKWSGFFRCFWQSLIWPCLQLVVKPLFLLWWSLSLDCRLWQRHVCLLESVLLLAGCCERVFLYHGEDSPIIHHCCPSVDVQAVLCFWAHQCVLFFSECTKLLIWPLIMFFCLSLMDLVFVLKPNNVCFTCMERSFDMMWAHATASDANGTLRINCRPFTLINWCRNN